MIPRRLLFALAALLLVAWPAVAQERRVALVIGNGAYRNAAPLANPVNDAQAMARTLREIGFAVTEARDLDIAAMRRVLREFGTASRGADVALLFFAGHGLQTGQRERAENHLVPIDAALADARDLEDETIRLSRVLELMEDAKARIVILDACRDNPLIPRMANAGGTRSVSRGLAPLEQAGQGTLVAFSTAPGAVAADGRGANSPFTEALVRHLPTRGLELRTVLTRVRADVARVTNNAQTPWSNDGLLSELFLAGAETPAPIPQPQIQGQIQAQLQPQPAPMPAPLPNLTPQVAPEALELVFWQSIQANPSVGDLEEYLRRFPNGVFSGLARNRLAELRRAADTAAAQREREEAERRRQEAERIRQAQEEAERRRQEADRLRREQDEAERRRQQVERDRLAAEEADRRRREDEARRREEEQRRRLTDRTGTDWTEQDMGLNPTTWTEIQRSLAALGFSVGTPDGIVGPRTRGALRDWQSRNGNPATGFMTQALLNDLRNEARGPLARLAAEEERRRVAEEERRRVAEEERRRREVEERSRVRRSDAVALAWNSLGAWATRAAPDLPTAQRLAVDACNATQGRTELCVVAGVSIPANTAMCFSLFGNGSQLGAATRVSRADAMRVAQEECERGRTRTCTERHWYCSEPR